MFDKRRKRIGQAIIGSVIALILIFSIIMLIKGPSLENQSVSDGNNSVVK